MIDLRIILKLIGPRICKFPRITDFFHTITLIQKQMTIRTTFDIHTQQKVYAICNSKTSQCTKLTTSLIQAIQFAQQQNK